MCVATVRNAGLQRINAVCQAGRHICGSGEGRVLLFSVSVDLITVTDGFLIRKVWRRLLSPCARTPEVKKCNFHYRKLEKQNRRAQLSNDVSILHTSNINQPHRALALSVTEISSLPEGHRSRVEVTLVFYYIGKICTSSNSVTFYYETGTRKEYWLIPCSHKANAKQENWQFHF